MTRIWRTLTVATVLLIALPGCRVFQKKDKDADGNERRDPLMGRYIPKTDLPVPGKDVAGRKDPLLTQPTNNTKGKTTASEKDTFRNTTETSVAGLTGRLNRVENSGMSLGDRREEVKPAARSGTGTPLKRDPDFVPDPTWERYTEDLKNLKARVERPILDTNGEYVLGASVPANDSGAMRRYEGRGASAADAAKDLLNQIRSER
ncbi:hypothetical protein BH11PLA2_BH11PLA2_13200 [soil metagenome]